MIACQAQQDLIYQCTLAPMIAAGRRVCYSKYTVNNTIKILLDAHGMDAYIARVCVTATTLNICILIVNTIALCVFWPGPASAAQLYCRIQYLYNTLWSQPTQLPPVLVVLNSAMALAGSMPPPPSLLDALKGHSMGACTVHRSSA